MLSTLPPADVSGEMRALPFAIAWLGTMVGAEIARSSFVPGLPALGPTLAMLISLLFTLEDRTVALLQGTAMVVGALVLGLIQAAAIPDEEASHTVVRRRTRAGVLAGLSLVLIAGRGPIHWPAIAFRRSQRAV